MQTLCHIWLHDLDYIFFTGFHMITYDCIWSYDYLTTAESSESISYHFQIFSDTFRSGPGSFYSQQLQVERIRLWAQYGLISDFPKTRILPAKKRSRWRYVWVAADLSLDAFCHNAVEALRSPLVTLTAEKNESQAENGACELNWILQSYLSDNMWQPRRTQKGGGFMGGNDYR